MLEVNFYDEVDDSFLKFAVIISKADGKWVFCKHIFMFFYVIKYIKT